MCSGTLAWPQWTNQSQCDAKFSFVLFTWAKFKWNLGEKNSFVLVLAYIMHPVWTSQVLCVWLLAVFYPLTETLEQILSPKLQHLGAAFSSSGTAVLHVCTGCEEGQDHQLLGPTEGPQTTLLPCWAHTSSALDHTGLRRPLGASKYHLMRDSSIFCCPLSPAVSQWNCIS